MKDDYDPIGSIAMYIAGAMQYPNADSTIKVDQYKNKFDMVCIYCSLADPTLVLESWVRSGNEGMPSVDYVAKRMDNDAFVYRTAYLMMVKLVPQYKEAILARPDYSFLLYDSLVELDEWIEKYGDKYMKKFRAGSVDELRTRLHKLYDRRY